MRGKEAFPALSGVIAPGQLKVVLSELLDRMSRAGVPDGDSVYATLAQIPPSVMLTAGIQRHTSRGSTGYCGNEEELLGVLGQFEGQPTATLHFLEADAHLARRLLKVLEGKVGRLMANGWPTGVEVSHAMVHGGPFPATSDGETQK